MISTFWMHSENSIAPARDSFLASTLNWLSMTSVFSPLEMNYTLFSKELIPTMTDSLDMLNLLKLFHPKALNMLPFLIKEVPIMIPQMLESIILDLKPN